MKAAAWAGSALLLAGACAMPQSVPGAWPAGGSYLQARGTGVPDPASVGDIQRRYTSRESARIEAQARLLRQIELLPMDQVGSARDAEQKDPAFASNLQAAVRGAVETQASWDASDDCTVTLRLDKSTLKALDSRFRF